MQLLLKRSGEPSEDGLVFDKLCTKELKGAAIIFVILGHMSIDKHIYIAPNMIYAGAWGVTLFLILSGFGITKSYLNNGINLSKLFGRIKSILIPYSVVTLVWILIDSLYLGKSYSAKTIFLALMGIDVKRSIDASMWYISIILFWYIIFYLSFRLPIKSFIKVLLLFCFSYVINKGYFNTYLLDLSYNWQLSAFSFPIGVTLALYSGEIKNYFKEVNLEVLLAIMTAGFFLLFNFFIKHNSSSIRYYIISNTFLSFSLIILITLLRKYNITSKFIEFIGSISYEMYLFEGVFMWKYSLLRIFHNKLISLILYFGVLILFSFAYNKFTKIIKLPASKAFQTN